GGVRFTRDQRHLADRLTRRHMGDKPAMASVILSKHAQAARHDQEQRLVVLAFPLQKRAAGQAEPCRFGEQHLERGVVHVRQNRKSAQALAQALRINRVTADLEGSQKRHFQRASWRTPFSASTWLTAILYGVPNVEPGAPAPPRVPRSRRAASTGFERR